MSFCLAYLIILLYNFVGDCMRLIEKRCPNCGASIEFSDDAKSCKCDYCNRSFEIERKDSDKKKPSAKDYTLELMKEPGKILGAFFIIGWIIEAILFTIIFAAIAIVIIILMFFAIKKAFLS